MSIDYRPITKQQALRPYAHLKTLEEREAALARDLSCAYTTIHRWVLEESVPKPWAIIIRNLLFPEKFQHKGK